MEKTVLYCYRYMWSYTGDKSKVNYKVIVDVPAGHDAFVSSLRKNEELEVLISEYLYECDASRVTESKVIYKKEDINDVEKTDKD